MTGVIDIKPEDVVQNPAMPAPTGIIDIKPEDIVKPEGRAKPARTTGETIVDWGKSLVTGEGRKEPGLEELPDEFVPGFGSMSSRMSLARTGEGKRDIYKEAHPEAKTRTDAYGNPVVTAPDGKEYYPNKPGASWRDIDDTMADMAFMAPGIRAGAVAGKFLGPLGRIAGSGAGAGAGSVAQDVAARGAGSDQPVDLPGALTYAAVGAGGEMLSPVLSPLARAVMKKPVVGQNGQLTPHGLNVLKEAGIDPATVTDGFAKRFALEADSAVNPAQAAKLAEAATLPVPVPHTRGMASGVPSEQMFEDLAAKGLYGETASATMRGAKDDTQQALHQNLPAIQAAVAKNQKPTLTQTGEAGPLVQDRLKGMAASDKGKVDAAYSALRSTDASLVRKGVDDIRVAAREALTDHDLLGLPATTRFLKQLDELVDGIPNNVGPTWAPPSAPVRTLIDMDKRLTNAQKAGGEEALALGKIKRVIRSKLDDALADGLIIGDDKTIDLFKEALKSHREYAARFKGDNVVGALVKPKRGAEPGTLAVSPEEASNVIFGSSRLFGGPEVSRNISRLKSLLGPDSPEWHAVREEAWLRFARAGEGPMKPDGGRAFSGTKFAKALDDTLRDHPGAMKALFTPEELGVMQQFKRVAARTTIPAEGGKNFSNTTPAMANAVQNLLGAAFMGEGAAARLMATIGVKSVYKMGMGLKAAGHRTGKTLEHRAAPGTAGTGAVVGTELSVEDRVRAKLDALSE